MQLKLVSWNVNGIRAASGKEGWSFFEDGKFDLIGLQETKASPEQLSDKLTHKSGFESYFASSIVKKGYSGTAVYSRLKPLKVEIELPDPTYQGEGRIVHLEFDRFHFFNGYFPNGGAAVLDEQGRPTGQFKRVPYKMGFFRSFLDYAQQLRRHKPVVVCGDFNIAHRPIDLAHPQQNISNTGFLPEERAFFDELLGAGFIDTFRRVHGDLKDQYTWWSYKTRARERNIGWRIDYFLVSEELSGAIVDAGIESTVTGSDHCPVYLCLDV
ncbi:MAG: exodeoxyribonuclease III [Succinivibrio sp.]|nr:exodeoxyribonuclease III [Succinivibrio sp.]